jgi:glycosyltransferase involved in cell wall biosynthesis
MSCRGWSSDAYWAARITVELGRLGHDATLVCRRGTDERVIGPARRLGVTAIETLRFPSGWHPAADAADVRGIAALLDRHDILHVHRGKEHWLAAVANRFTRRRRPLVRSRHIVHPVRAHPLNRWLYGAATDLVVTPTEAIRRQLVAAGLVPEGKAHALPGGVDAQRFAAPADPGALRARLGVAGDVALIGHIGGFRAMKGHRVVIEAFARLVGAGRRAHLVMAGRGPEEGPGREAVRRAGLDAHVSVLGPVDDVPATMAGLDAGLYVPVHSEGMSRVVHEYLAAGCPLVASRVGVVPEVLEDGATALLVPADDAEAVAAALARLLDDPALAARLGRAGRALAHERLSGARVAGRLVELYAAQVGRARA